MWNKTNDMSGINKILCVVIVVLVVFSVYMWSEKRNLENTIIEKNDLIRKGFESLSDVVPIRMDTASNKMYFILNRNSNGDLLKYNDLDSIIKAQELIIEKYDAVILAAKQVYKFNYRVSVKDSTIRVGLWNK